ncbi:MAG: tetratricopeptide repeat protein [Anaerolineae bacterium]|nr:tetratricopeptide repeat protein [Anaerolineae bacterium]
MSKMYLRRGLVGLLAVICLLLRLSPENKQVITEMQLGGALASEQQYGASLKAYERVAAQRPGCPRAYLACSRVYIAQERYEEAWEAYLAAFRLGGRNAETVQVVAQLYRAQGVPELAIEVLKSSLERRPNRVDLWMHLAEGYVAAKEWDGAQETFAHVLGMDLSDGQRQYVHDELGMLCIVEFDLDCALAHFQDVVSGPDLTLTEKAGVLLAALYRLKQGDEPALARAKLGQALFEYGDLAPARQQFQSAVDIEPAYVDGHAYLGYVLSLIGEDEPAVRHLKRAISLEPTYPLPYYFLGMHYARQGWWITARDILVQAHDLDPSNPAVCAAVAETYIRSQDPSYGVAERWLHVAVDNAPQDVRFHLLLAHFYVDYGIDPGNLGVTVARVAIDLAPENGEAHETLGWAYYLAGNADLALKSLVQARQLEPLEPRIHYRLGEVYRALGRQEEAIASYQRAIDLDWNGSVGKKAHWALEDG